MFHPYRGGTYELVKRYRPKHGWHLMLKNVPYRQLILVHVANDGTKELKGCIAALSLLTGEGIPGLRPEK